MRISDWSSDVCSSDLLLAQGVGDQGQVDAQAQVAAEGGLAVVPPAEDAAGVVVQAEGVVQAQRLQAAQGVAFGGGGEDVVVVPDGRVVHVAVVGGDVEVANNPQPRDRKSVGEGKGGA